LVVGGVGMCAACHEEGGEVGGGEGGGRGGGGGGGVSRLDESCDNGGGGGGCDAAGRDTTPSLLLSDCDVLFSCPLACQRPVSVCACVWECFRVCACVCVCV